MSGGQRKKANAFKFAAKGLQKLPSFFKRYVLMKIRVILQTLKLVFNFLKFLALNRKLLNTV